MMLASFKKLRMRLCRFYKMMKTYRFPAQTVKKILIAILLSIIVVFGFHPQIQAQQSKPAFYPGEKLTFLLRWEFIPAGEAVLEVRPKKNMNGIQAYHFVMTAKSNSFIDIFYKVRDRIDAYTDLKMTNSVYYKKKQREGKHKRDVTVKFDWEKGEAQYSNFGKEQKTIPLMPGSFDPLSALYYTRSLELKENSQIKRPVTDGKKNVIGNANIIKREKITLPNGTYDTYLIEPDIKEIGGVFKESKNAKIQVWVTADHRHIPVRVKSEVVVGSFVGELISAEGIK
jgi:hypothetical protein